MAARTRRLNRPTPLPRQRPSTRGRPAAEDALHATIDSPSALHSEVPNGIVLCSCCAEDSRSRGKRRLEASNLGAFCCPLEAPIGVTLRIVIDISAISTEQDE